MARFNLGDVPIRQQILLFLILAVGGGYMFYLWYIQPLRDTSERLGRQVQDLQLQIQQAKLVEAQLPQFKQQVRDQQRKLREFRATLPSEKETPELMRAIQALAVNTHLGIRSFTPQKTVSRDFYVDWPIEISMEGNYHNLATFFEKVGRIQRLVNIGDVTIRGLEEGSATKDRTIAATCTATTFVYLEDENDADPQAEKSGAS